MRYFLLILALVSILVTIKLATATDVVPVEWDHGWKTDYVVATRYSNPTMGFNIGFTFPKQPHNSDRAETFNFLGTNGCEVFQGGGFPGAPLYAICKGVTDKETANKFLIDFLPKLDAHMRSLH